MLNFDFIWGLDDFLVELGLVELWHLTIVHAFLLAAFFIINLMVISPLIRLLNKDCLVTSKSIVSAVGAFAFIWPIIFGHLWFLLGAELSLARHLYVYLVLLVMFIVSQIHIDIVVPNYQGESKGGRIEARDRENK